MDDDLLRVVVRARRSGERGKLVRREHGRVRRDPVEVPTCATKLDGMRIRTRANGQRLSAGGAEPKDRPIRVHYIDRAIPIHRS